MRKIIFITNILIFFEIIALERSLLDTRHTPEIFSEEEQKAISQLARDLYVNERYIQSNGIYESLLEGCSASSPQEATCQLQQLFNEVNDTKWRVFRQQAACLINLGASVNIARYSYSLLTEAVSHWDYPFAKFLLEHGAKPDKDSLRHVKAVLTAKLLIKYGANPLETDWSVYKDPLNLAVVLTDRQPELLEFYITEYGCNPNKKYKFNGIENNYNLLHGLLNEFHKRSDFKKKASILLKYGVDPYEKNAEGDSAIDMAQKKEPEIRDAFNEAINEYKEYKNELKEILIETKDLDYDVAEHLIGYILPQSKKD